MNTPILLTGVSSFTGHAFALQLAEAGYHVVGTLTREIATYQDPIVSARIQRLRDRIELADKAPVGSDKFVNLLSSVKPQITCMHHAVVGDYKSPNFNIPSAIAQATFNAELVTSSLASVGCGQVILTRSVFEGGQGLSDDPDPIGGYAIAKTATVDTWKVSARRHGLTTRDFTITNPVGPYEQPRLPKYLLANWMQGLPAELSAPNLIRDNVPIDLLSQSFADFVSGRHGERSKFAPSFWVASNIDFARRMAEAYRSILGVDCLVTKATEIKEAEPRIRTGVDQIKPTNLWSEDTFWQSHADYWLPRMNEGRK